jgi:hypothetical protein
MMIEANSEILNYIQSYYEIHKKRPSVKTICDSLENVSKRKFYESFPEGIGRACELLGIPIDQKQIDSTKKARKTKKDKPRISEDAERIREDKEILALKPEIFKLMRISGVDTPGEALRTAEATAIAMNPWVVNRGVKTAPELIKLLEKEREEAINIAKNWKVKSEIQKKEIIELLVKNEVLIEMPIITYLKKKGLSNFVIEDIKSEGWEDNIIGYINDCVEAYYEANNNCKMYEAAFNKSQATLKECIRRYKEDIQ